MLSLRKLLFVAHHRRCPTATNWRSGRSATLWRAEQRAGGRALESVAAGVRKSMKYEKRQTPRTGSALSLSSGTLRGSSLQSRASRRRVSRHELRLELAEALRSRHHLGRHQRRRRRHRQHHRRRHHLHHRQHHHHHWYRLSHPRS